MKMSKNRLRDEFLTIKSCLFKLSVILLNIFAILFLAFSLYSMGGSLYNQLWAASISVFFLVLLGSTVVLMTYQLFLKIFRNKTRLFLTKLANSFAVGSFLYFTSLSTYIYFIEQDGTVWKQLIFGIVATLLAVINMIVAKRKQ
ncbi:hypothetical protein [Candidatus Enterococcus willemsii]|uniref:Uncharacterized protein n=1 Tax=Candidatus Enterococcus willemsii TaxID=1857215 RepID=A0ABQ6Z2A5_9ENTE|nr:hypothetical protein [Enterococcus sp. CU12B]KAF1305607.1 hypothetical protein BAU17_13370 [Enterococcus sp. CU12B]